MHAGQAPSRATRVIPEPCSTRARSHCVDCKRCRMLRPLINQSQRHQVFEVLPMHAHVDEYRLYSSRCKGCGACCVLWNASVPDVEVADPAKGTFAG